MKALSIRQPWAYLILSGIKRIENRAWATTYRGPLLIHAAQRVDDLNIVERHHGLRLPRSRLQTGGIVGVVDLLDVVGHPGECDLSPQDEPWYIRGHYAWVLRNPRPVRFTPLRGQQGLFDIPFHVEQLVCS